MTFKQLEAFYYAATLGSFALASQRTHVTHSSLSKRIAELESWLGEPLFDRSGKTARLTEAGEQLLPQAGSMLRQKEAVRANLRDQSQVVGTCRLGITELGALTWLPHLVQRVKLEHPGLLLKPYVNLGHHLENQVARGELDCAVISGPAQDSRLVTFHVADVLFTLAASPTCLGLKGKDAASKLSEHSLIAMTEGSASNQAFDIWSQANGVKMQRAVASNSLMAIIGLTIAGLGVSVLPQNFIQPWIRAGVVYELDGCEILPAVPFNFIRREDDHRHMLNVMNGYVTRFADYSLSASFIM